MQTARITLSSDLFSYSKKDGLRMLVTEMSSIPNWPAPVYNPNGTGKPNSLDIKSERTGAVETFKYQRDILAPDGEFAGVVFVGYPGSTKVEVHILND